MVCVLVTLALLLQTPVASPKKSFYVIDSPQDKVDCQSGQKLKKQTLEAGTLVIIKSTKDKLLNLVAVASGKEVCIRARQRDLIAAKPYVLPDGTTAEFVGSDNSVEAPRLLEAPKRTPLILSAADSENILPNVIVIYAVTADGTVENCRALRSSAATGWDNWAMSLVCNSKYAPATKNGIPVAVTMIATFSVGHR